MATVKEKEARRIKALPFESPGSMVWCKEHRAFSDRLIEMAGRNVMTVLDRIGAIKGKPYPEFVPTQVWNDIELESWSRPSSEKPHWFLTPEKDIVVIQFEAGDTIWQCGDGGCGRWWPDKASATQCYESHQ